LFRKIMSPAVGCQMAGWQARTSLPPGLWPMAACQYAKEAGASTTYPKYFSVQI
jgi:hypothetical protein